MRKQQTNYAAADSTATERAVSSAWIGIAAMVVLAGCARTSVEHDVKAASTFPRPKTVVVHDFTIFPHDVVLDSGVRARLQRALSETPDQRLAEDFYVTVKSSLKPGVGVAGGAGAPLQRTAQGAETAAGVGALAARSQTVEADASNAAKQIAQELKKLYQQQGWI